jgi:K(+)-stimulated pyrophosphate-energized sodium pump
MNILIKLMSIVSLVIAPTLASIHGTRREARPATHTPTKSEKTVMFQMVNSGEKNEKLAFYK